MALVSFSVLRAERQRQQLVAEADAEDRHVGFDQLAAAPARRTAPVAAGSPGPFDRNTPSGLWRRMSSAVAVAGTTVTAQPVLAQAAQDVALGAVVDRDDVELGACLRLP